MKSRHVAPASLRPYAWPPSEPLRQIRRVLRERSDARHGQPVFGRAALGIAQARLETLLPRGAVVHAALGRLERLVAEAFAAVRRQAVLEDVLEAKDAVADGVAEGHAARVLLVVEEVGVREGVPVQEREEGHLVADERVGQHEGEVFLCVAACARGLNKNLGVRLERTETQSSCRDHDGDAEALPEEKSNDELDAGELGKRPVRIDDIVRTTCQGAAART
jgi:hypothetical protein